MKECHHHMLKLVYLRFNLTFLSFDKMHVIRQGFSDVDRDTVATTSTVFIENSSKCSS